MPEKSHTEDAAMRWQHFLVPLDFSPDADHALEYAIGLAAVLQAHVALLHVLELPKLVDMSLTPYRVQMETETRRALAARLQRVHQAGVAGDMMRVHGVPFQEIIAMAKTTGADLIIMGTHGRTGLHHVLMGSVAEKVVRLAPCAVLVTRLSDAPTPEGEAEEAPGTVSGRHLGHGASLVSETIWEREPDLGMGRRIVEPPELGDLGIGQWWKGMVRQSTTLEKHRMERWHREDTYGMALI